MDGELTWVGPATTVTAPGQAPVLLDAAGRPVTDAKLSPPA